jgi:hypothetical protein
VPRQQYPAEYYEAEIRKLYPAVQLLRAYCEANPEDTATLKELEDKEGSLRYNKKMWASRKQIIVQVASNEGLENSAEELRCQTEPMKTYDEKKWPYKQVGDYVAYVPGIGWYPVCRERKTLEDLYGTLMDKEHRKNLFEEFDRFLVDNRFTIFRFDLECTEEEFYNYLPHWPKTCKFCDVKRQKMDSGEYFCPLTLQILESYPGPDFKCHEGFCPRPRDRIELQRIRTSKRTYLRQCREKGFQIEWRGSREAACEAYREGVEEWLKLNYVKLLKLDVRDDRAELLKKKAFIEAELAAVNGALEEAVKCI